MTFPAAEVFSLMYCGLRLIDTLCVLSHVVNNVPEGYTAYRFRAEGKERGSRSLQNAAAHRQVKNFS